MDNASGSNYQNFTNQEPTLILTGKHSNAATGENIALLQTYLVDFVSENIVNTKVNQFLF